MVGKNLLLLDEPTEGIAPVLALRMGEILASLKKEGVSIIIAESNDAHVASVIDRTYVIERGSIVKKLDWIKAMSEPGRFVAEGVIPATLVAFHDDFSIDIAASRKHLRDVVNVGGLSAVTVNGHASEIHAFTLVEQQSLLAASLAEAGDEPLVNGVYADGSHAAAEVARMAAAEGASALLIFPPNSMSMGGAIAA